MSPALTYAELEDYRRFGLKGPVAVIPNGTLLPPQHVSARTFLDQFPELEAQRLVLFFSRVHYKKGVDILCRAWAKVSPQFRDAHLVIAGPDAENTLASIKTLISELNIEGRATITGMLSGDMKWSALRAATLFVLPSYSEGFSMAILEAMASSLPVLVTHACNFPDIEKVGAGLLIQTDQRELEHALLKLLEQSPKELGAIGTRGLQLVSRRYTWSAVGTMMAEVYDWLLGGVTPVTVEIERLS